MYEHDGWKECTDESGCTSDGLIAFRDDDDTGRCIPFAQCTAYGGYLLQADPEPVCVNASTCFELGKYAYTINYECDSQKPDPDGNFDEALKAKHIYKCSSEHEYFDANGESTKCVSVAECIADNKLDYIPD